MQVSRDLNIHASESDAPAPNDHGEMANMSMSVSSTSTSNPYPRRASGVGLATRSANALPSTSQASATDQVTISSAAQDAVAKDAGATQARTPVQERLLGWASANPAAASKLAGEMAEGNSTIFYDISGDRPGAPMSNRLTTGRVIDDDFKKAFYSQASGIDAHRRAIYDSETAKGTDPTAILGKMIDYTNSQSEDYLEASGWSSHGMA